MGECHAPRANDGDDVRVRPELDACRVSISNAPTRTLYGRTLALDSRALPTTEPDPSDERDAEWGDPTPSEAREWARAYDRTRAVPLGTPRRDPRRRSIGWLAKVYATCYGPGTMSVRVVVALPEGRGIPLGAATRTLGPSLPTVAGVERVSEWCHGL